MRLSPELGQPRERRPVGDAATRYHRAAGGSITATRCTSKVLSTWVTAHPGADLRRRGDLDRAGRSHRRRWRPPAAPRSRRPTAWPGQAVVAAANVPLVRVRWRPVRGVRVQRSEQTVELAVGEPRPGQPSRGQHQQPDRRPYPTRSVATRSGGDSAARGGGGWWCRTSTGYPNSLVPTPCTDDVTWLAHRSAGHRRFRIRQQHPGGSSYGCSCRL